MNILENAYEDAISKSIISESKRSHLKHLFDDGTLTFDDMRNIFKNVFIGKICICPMTENVSVENISEVEGDCLCQLKKSITPQNALDTLLTKLDSLVKDIGYKATVNDYVKERYARDIVNCALQHGIDVYKNSDFVNEMIARLSHVFNHRPTRADLLTYAKHEKINTKNSSYKDFIDQLEMTAEETNDSIMKPIENLVMSAGTSAIRCLLPILAIDKSKPAQQLCLQINDLLKVVSDDNDGLTPDKIKLFRQCMKALDTYQTKLSDDGMTMMMNGKIYKIHGNIGLVNQLMKLMNY